MLAEKAYQFYLKRNFEAANATAIQAVLKHPVGVGVDGNEGDEGALTVAVRLLQVLCLVAEQTKNDRIVDELIFKLYGKSDLLPPALLLFYAMLKVNLDKIREAKEIVETWFSLSPHLIPHSEEYHAIVDFYVVRILIRHEQDREGALEFLRYNDLITPQHKEELIQLLNQEILTATNMIATAFNPSASASSSSFPSSSISSTPSSQPAGSSNDHTTAKTAVTENASSSTSTTTTTAATATRIPTSTKKGTTTTAATATVASTTTTTTITKKATSPSIVKSKNTMKILVYISMLVSIVTLASLFIGSNVDAMRKANAITKLSATWQSVKNQIIETAKMAFVIT